MKCRKKIKRTIFLITNIINSQYFKEYMTKTKNLKYNLLLDIEYYIMAVYERNTSISMIRVNFINILTS